MQRRHFLYDLGVEYPIIQAPMAGGASTVTMIAATCQAGALGSLAASYLTAEQILEAAAALKKLTFKPFGINLFAPTEMPTVTSQTKAIAHISSYHQQLGLPDPVAVQAAYGFEGKLEAALESGASVFSYTFGHLPEATIEAIKARGMQLIGTATAVEEALLLQQQGVDAIVAQGSEAGGHRGSFLAGFDESMIGTMALVPQIADATQLPVIASGGIMDGRGIAAALMLGADAVQLGTAFLSCHEAGVPEAYKQALLAKGQQTKVTTAFSGRPARGIVNRFMLETETTDGAILPYPMQNALTRNIRSEAARQGKAELLSLWAGQGLALSKRQSVSELITRLVAETKRMLAKASEASGF